MVRFFQVARSYDGAEVLVDVNLSIEKGELLLVNGPAGSGKTTLVKLLLGIEPPTRGWITVDGFTLSSAWLAAHRRRIAVIPQGGCLVAELTAAQNVALSLEVTRASRPAAMRGAIEMLEHLGLASLADRPCDSLSAGERQWVAIARALVREQAQLLVADEPATSLDSSGAELLAEIFEERRRRGTTVVITSQHTGFPGLLGQRVVMLDRGRIALDSAALDGGGDFSDLEEVRAL